MSRRHGAGGRAVSAHTASSPTACCRASRGDGYNAVQLMAIHGASLLRLLRLSGHQPRSPRPRGTVSRTTSNTSIDTAHGLGHARAAGSWCIPIPPPTSARAFATSSTARRFSTSTRARPSPRLGQPSLFAYGRARGDPLSCSRTSSSGMDEYHFDGFRFDGVTSMIYQRPRTGRQLYELLPTTSACNTDVDALTYLHAGQQS